MVSNVDVSEYLDTLSSYVELAKSYNIVNDATNGIFFRDTLELTNIVKNSQGQISSWSEFTNSGNMYREYKCTYASTESPYFSYTRHNIYPVNPDLVCGSTLSYLMSLLHNDSKNLPLNINEYSIDSLTNEVNSEYTFSYGYDATGRLNAITSRIVRANGHKRTLKLQIIYK